MADAPKSKSAKKNQKRRAAAAKKKSATTPSQQSGTGFSILEDVPTGSRHSPSPPPPAPVDPITALKLQIEEAKSAKDHERAQELRQQLWVLQDTVHLGTTGPGAPHSTDISSILTPPIPSSNMTEQILGPVSGDPTEKKLNKLHKKLQQIQSLKERFASGEQLESTQLTKIKSEDEVQDEIEFLEKLLEHSQLK